MSDVRELHNKAMKLSDEADALLRVDTEAALGLMNEACLLEEMAASMIEPSPENEPTRSILYTSAASMAMQARDFKHAQRLVGNGLSGYPKAREERGLLDLMEQITMESHLDLKGVILENRDLQLSIFGDYVGAGFAPINIFKERITSLGSILRRTFLRLSGEDYSSKKPSKGLSLFEPVLSVPRTSSFAVTVRLARPTRSQLPLIEQVSAASVIDEVMTCIEYLNDGNESGLSERINDDAYYLNFITMAKAVAPDGDKVRLVGLTSNERRVKFSKTRSAVSKLPIPDVKPVIDEVKIHFAGTGRLDYVSGREDLIGLDVDGKVVYITMQDGLEDFVKQFYGQEVLVIGEQNSKGIVTPVDLNPVED